MDGIGRSAYRADMRARLGLLATLALVLPLLGVAGPGEAEQRAVPALDVDVVATGLDRPWDVAALPGGDLLVTQRDRGTLTLVDPDTGAKRNLGFPSSSVWASGETGLLGLAVDPGFTRNRRIYTCNGWRMTNGTHDVRVMAWRLDAARTKASYAGTLIRSFPTSSGRHGGCRVMVQSTGALMIGTGDAAQTRNPQNLDSLGGKVLRVHRVTGAAWPSNPWAKSSGKRRFVYTYGHRNVQGLVQRPDGSVWSVEHGTYRDDEINLIGSGRNYGWRPGPGYDESRPMTDMSIPGTQYAARWRSGDPTIAPSGMDVVVGSAWGDLNGSLAVAVLKGQRLMFAKFDRYGKLQFTRSPAELRGYGRLRDVARSGGRLYVTTDNGNGEDVVLRVTPR